MAERLDTMSGVMLDEFRSQFEASCVSSYSEELWYNETVCLWMTEYIYNYEWRNWYIKLEITMTRKSGTHLHVTYGAMNSCFDLIRSHQQCTPWSPPLEIEPTTTVCRSWNSTTGPLVHATYKRYRINKSW